MFALSIHRDSAVLCVFCLHNNCLCETALYWLADRLASCSLSLFNFMEIVSHHISSL